MRKLTIKLSEQLNIAAVAFESQEGILVTDANNVIIRVNNSFTDITGYTAEEVIGKNTRILGSGLHDAKFFATMWETLNDMGAWAGEIHNRRKNGETYQTSLNITAVKNQNGIVANYVSTFTDITGRKQAEEILRKTNVELSLFRKLLDSSSDAIETLDPITLRFLDVNEKACRDLGYSREELLSMSIFDIDPSFDQDARKMIGEQIQKTGAARFESTHRRKDGSTFAVEISIGSANLDNPYGLCVVRDITERKLVEEKIHELNEALEAKVQERTKQLVQAQEELGRKEKLAVLGQVAGSVGHELRNPLGVMNNAVYYLQTVLADADSTVCR
jgi:PAS domain S-box-containing protein